MINLKMSKKSKKEMEGTTMPAMAEQPQYPYGFSLSFNKEQIAKIPCLKSIKIGTAVSVEGIGKVARVESTERQNGEDSFSVEIQLTDIGVEPKSKDKIKGSMTETIRKSQNGIG